MANLLTVSFAFGGILRLRLNVRDWYSSQVIISENEDAAAPDGPAPLRRPIAHSHTARHGPALLSRLYRLAQGYFISPVFYSPQDARVASQPSSDYGCESKFSLRRSMAQFHPNSVIL